MAGFSLSSIFRIPKPRSFLRVVSLRTATEFITFTLLINKVTGLYGILALFTGYHLNALQFSNYIYSLIILGLGVWLAPAVRNPRAPLRNVGLAWLYILDTLINSTYTIFFGMGWFVLLAQHLNEDISVKSGTANAIGQGTMADTAGFTDPEVPGASKVEIVATPAKGVLSGQDAVVYASTGASAGNTPSSLHDVLTQPDSLTTIILLAIFGLIRIYFCLIMLSYARGILRGYIASSGNSTAAGYADASADASMAENPFRKGAEDASGLGRLMLRLPTRRYWLGREEYPAASAAEWERLTSGRFEDAAKKELMVKIPADGSSGPGGEHQRTRSARSVDFVGGMEPIKNA